MTGTLSAPSHRAPERSPLTKRSRRVLTAATAVCLGLGGAGLLHASSATAAVGQLAYDGFDRTLTGSWGQTGLGGWWQTKGGNSVGVNASRGVVNLSPGTDFRAQLSGTWCQDCQTRASFVIPSTLRTYAGVESRRSSDGSAYRGRAYVDPNGRVFVQVLRLNGSTATLLSSVDTGRYAGAGSVLFVNLSVTGTSTVSVKARAWFQGEGIPNWQAGVDDSSASRLSNGGFGGVHVYLAGSATRSDIRIDDVSVFDGDTGAAPATTSPTTTTPSTTTPATTPTPTQTTPAPAAPAPAAPVAASGSRGAAQPGDTSYAVPSNALHVAPWGSDSAAGTSGAPLKTVNAAVNKAWGGQTIVLRGGTYHESVVVTKSVTIQSYPGEAVWFDGARQVTGWQQSGNTWVAPWTAQFSHPLGYWDGANDSRYLRSGYPYAAWPDMVFVNGTALKQVDRGSVGPGTFAVDYASKQLIIGTNPSGQNVTASDLSQAFDAQVSGVTLRGFGVAHYATPMKDLGAVRLDKGNSTAENIYAVDNATSSVSISGNATINKVTSIRAGMVGLHANEADGGSIRNSLVVEANAEMFNALPSSAGIKFTRSRGITADNNEVRESHGNIDGIWVDESCVGITITRNKVTGHGRAGIEIELSNSGIVADNYVGNGTMGIYIYNTGDLTIANNVMYDNTHADLYLSQDSRRQANGGEGVDPRQPMPDPTNPWLLRNLKVLNNVFGKDNSSSYFQFYVLDKESRISADNMNITVDGNSFVTKAAESDPTMIGWGGSDNYTVYKYESGAAFNAAKGRSATNYLVPAGTSVASHISLANGQSGYPLPSDVAAAIGQSAGSRHVGTFTAN